MKISVLTHSPSPYQVEFLSSIAQHADCRLAVFYLFSQDPARSWAPLEIEHEHHFLDGAPEPSTVACAGVSSADLVVLNYYNDPRAAGLLKIRTGAGKPWVLWGERPGSRGNSTAARLLRRWRLRALYASRAPIWGIGRFAVEGYRREFGGQRAYRNIPYFSDLSRFHRLARARQAEVGRRVFLLSGALIQRKGVDLLAQAFVRLARELPGVRLRLLGDGSMGALLRQLLAPVSHQVEFLGFRDWGELPAVYGAADILCAPSRYDGWGMIVPEGLAAGLPVIGTERTGAALEFLESGRNGWLIRAGDGEALHVAMREAALLPAGDLETMSAAARRSVEGHSLELGAQRFLAAAREAVAGWST